MQEEAVNLVFIVENGILREELKGTLALLNLQYEEEEEFIKISVENFRLFIKDLYERGSLSELKAKNIWLIVLSLGESLKPSHIKHAQSLSFWFSHVECEDYMEILKDGRLTVYFQPIVDKNLSVVGYECLARGMGRGSSVLSPAYLFDCAEKTESVFYLDRLCREISIKTSAEKGLYDSLIFINFVPTSIYNPDTCLRTTMELVETYGLKHENIVFEVVESQRVKDIKHLRDILNYYREKGFKVALDDVGSGFSGLINLVNLYPDIVKIDMEIVRNINGDYLKQGVVDALVEMCKKNGIKVLAEGIETVGELDFLLDKVDYMQGFLFAKPGSEPVKTLNLKNR